VVALAGRALGVLPAHIEPQSNRAKGNHSAGYAVRQTDRQQRVDNAPVTLIDCAGT
jgi:hypothetical protein